MSLSLVQFPQLPDFEVDTTVFHRAKIFPLSPTQIERYDPNQRKRFQSTLLAYGQNTDKLFMALDAWLELKMSRLAQLDILQQLLQTKVAYERELEIR